MEDIAFTVAFLVVCLAIVVSAALMWAAV